MVALCGYFLDLECLVNCCDHDLAVSVAHGECVSPVVIPDAAPMPALVAEFAFLPILADLARVCAVSQEESPPLCAVRELRPPPEFLLSSVGLCRRGPPVLS